MDDFNKNYLSRMWSEAKRAAGGLWEDAVEAAAPVVQSAASGILSFGETAINKILSGVNKVLPNMLPTMAACLATLSYRGSQGNFATVSYPVVLTATFLDISGTNPRKFGHPCCKSRPIMDLNGFCLTKNAQFHISGTVIEEEALETMFNAGVILDWSGS